MYYRGGTDCNLFIIWYSQPAWQISGNALIWVLPKPMSALKHIGERLGNISRRHESAGMNGEGVVEINATGQSMRLVGERNCIQY